MRNSLVPSATAAIAAAGLAVAGCGSSSTTTASQPHKPGVTSSERTSKTAAAPACTAADLRLSFLGGQGATGHGLLGFALRNGGSASCSVYGYPTVALLGRSGHPLAARVTDASTDFFGSVAEARINLAAGREASFRLTVSHGGGSNAGCAVARSLRAIPPGASSALRAAIRPAAYVCGGATVSPIVAGTTAGR
jgi:hypothetical protein